MDVSQEARRTKQGHASAVLKTQAVDALLPASTAQPASPAQQRRFASGRASCPV